MSADQRTRLLRRCSHGPRTLHELTRSDEDSQIRNHIEHWLAEFVAAGLLELIEAEGYQTTDEGLIQVAKNAEPTSIAASRTHCGATMEPGSYVSEISKVPARGEGAMRAYRLPSLGYGA